MATLYELEAAVNSCIKLENDERYVDTETGEILDLEAFEKLELERDVKREQVALYIKNKMAYVQMIKAEADALLKRADRMKHEAERIKEYLAVMLNGEKFETPRVKITWRNVEAVEVEDPTLLPEEYQRIKVEADKTSIKKALKAGEDVAGAELVARRSMTLK